MTQGWGRFFAIDPLSPNYPYNSSYAFSENRVIDAVELEGLEIGIIIGAEARATALVSVSQSVDIVFYVDGVLNNDPLKLKVILVGIEGHGGGTIGVNGGVHAGIWIGDDAALAGTGLTFGVDVHVAEGVSLAIGLSQGGYTWEDNLPAGISITAGVGIGLSADIYGEETQAQTKVLLELSDTDIINMITSFLANPSDKNRKKVSKALDGIGYTVGKKTMKTVQTVAKTFNKDKRKIEKGIAKKEKAEAKSVKKTKQKEDRKAKKEKSSNKRKVEYRNKF